MEAFDRFLSHARSEVAGADANVTLWNLRKSLEAEHASAVLYEIVLTESSTWEGFLHQQVPRLTEHLTAKGLPMLGGPNVCISVWRGSSMFVFSCGSFFDAICEIEELDSTSLREHIGDWRVAIGLERSGGSVWRAPSIDLSVSPVGTVRLGLPARAGPSHNVPSNGAHDDASKGK
jgi:hypothetical protein